MNTKSTEFKQFGSFHGSNVGCFLLHQNEPNVNFSIDKNNRLDPVLPKYNPFFMPAVNIRTSLELDKMVPCSTVEEQKKNILWTAACSTDSSNNPINGNLHVVMGSYTIVDAAASKLDSIDPMSLVLETTNSQPPVKAVPATPEVFRNALKWLNPSEGFDISDEELPSRYIATVNNLHVPNGSSHQLKAFILERSWSGDHLWGGPSEEFISLAEFVEEESLRWRLYRLYITQNFAWQTRIAFYAIDGLHRIATSDMVYNGMYPPLCSENLRKKVMDFCKALVVPNDAKRRLHFKNGNSVNCIDTYVTLNYHVPDVFDEQFCMDMNEESARIQTNIANQSPHTIIHLLSSLIPFCFNEYKKGCYKSFPKYLFDPDSEDPKSLMKLLSTEQGPFLEFFLECLANDGLCEDKDDFEKNILPHLMTEDRNDHVEHVQYPHVLAETYSSIWLLNGLSKVIYQNLRDFVKRFPNISSIEYDYVNLCKMAELPYENFKSAFRRVGEGKGSSKASKYADYLVNMPKHNDLKIHFKAFVHGAGRSYFNEDLFKRPIENTKDYFPCGFIEILQVLVYCHLSPSSHKSVMKFLHDLKSSQCGMSISSRSRQEASRTCIKALIATVDVTSDVSSKYWGSQRIYSGKTKRGKTIQGNHPLEKPYACDEKHIFRTTNNSLVAFLMISSIRYSCKFFGSVGISVEPLQEFNDYVKKYRTREDMSSHFLQLLCLKLGDPILLYCVAFLHQVMVKQDMDKKKEALQSALDHSISQYMPIGTAAHKKSTNHIGRYTVGGCATLCPALDRTNKNLQSDNYLHLPSIFEVIQRTSTSNDVGLSHQNVTHRIDQYVNDSLDLNPVLEYLHELALEQDREEEKKRKKLREDEEKKEQNKEDENVTEESEDSDVEEEKEKNNKEGGNAVDGNFGNKNIDDSGEVKTNSGNIEGAVSGCNEENSAVVTEIQLPKEVEERKEESECIDNRKKLSNEIEGAGEGDDHGVLQDATSIGKSQSEETGHEDDVTGDGLVPDTDHNVDVETEPGIDLEGEEGKKDEVDGNDDELTAGGDEIHEAANVSGVTTNEEAKLPTEPKESEGNEVGAVLNIRDNEGSNIAEQVPVGNAGTGYPTDDEMKSSVLEIANNEESTIHHDQVTTSKPKPSNPSPLRRNPVRQVNVYQGKQSNFQKVQELQNIPLVQNKRRKKQQKRKIATSTNPAVIDLTQDDNVKNIVSLCGWKFDDEKEEKELPLKFGTLDVGTQVTVIQHCYSLLKKIFHPSDAKRGPLKKRRVNVDQGVDENEGESIVQFDNASPMEESEESGDESSSGEDESGNASGNGNDEDQPQEDGEGELDDEDKSSSDEGSDDSDSEDVLVKDLKNSMKKPTKEDQSTVTKSFGGKTFIEPPPLPAVDDSTKDHDNDIPFDGGRDESELLDDKELDNLTQDYFNHFAVPNDDEEGTVNYVQKNFTE